MEDFDLEKDNLALSSGIQMVKSPNFLAEKVSAHFLCFGTYFKKNE